MSFKNKGPPIPNIDQRKDVQQIGRIAVDIHNEQKPDTLIFHRVINGLEIGISDIHGPRILLYTLVVEAINKDKIIWTYVTSIKITKPSSYELVSFKDPLGYYT
ncbi:hypothetical protein Csa_021380 [Cucumis sativus]|nr:hypothetical protein Csa_021380 [Cucumis sativus]